MLIADSSIWVHYLRDPSSPAGRALGSLLRNESVVMAGPVLAEILQGARSEADSVVLASHLDALPYVDADYDTWVRAGELGAYLRKRGLKVALADLAIAALAMRHSLALYTLDSDFKRIPGLELHSPGPDGRQPSAP